MVWIRVAGSPQTCTTLVVKLKMKSAAIVSGGSLASWSDTRLAVTVTVHVSLAAKSVSGFSVKVVGPPLTVAVWAPLLAQEMLNQLPLTATGSLKVMSMLASSATPAAPLDGIVLATVGAVSLLRGFGAPAVKSSALLLVSTAPFPARSAAVVLLRVGAAPLPSK